MEFSHITRDQNIAQMQRRVFDVVVIGGGITGAGVAREAALRGLSVALLEKGDFASGTSSKSARMVHGGLRYLEQLQIGLVISACAERFKLQSSAPRTVHSTVFLFPVYHHTRSSLTQINLGMWAYEFLALFRNIKLHRIIPPEEVKASEPTLLQEELKGAVSYYDCLADDARLTLATVKAAHTLGALVANYVEVTDLIKENGKVVGVKARDLLGGDCLSISGHVVANATGAWVDTVRLMDDPGTERHLRPNRGSHICVPRERVPVNHVLIFTGADGERSMYAVPWGNIVIVGTTDLDHFGDLDAVYATSEEVEFMLASINQIIPGAQLTFDDVIATFAGLRPLMGGKKVAAYQASRDHEVFESPSGLVSIVGGKLTTHRKMAEDMIDHIVKKLAKEGHAIRTQTIDQGASPIEDPSFDAALELSGLHASYTMYSLEILSYLVNAYGPGAGAILSIAGENEALARQLVPDRPYLYAEIPYTIQNEMAVRLTDFMIRRTHIIYETVDQGLGAARSAARIMGHYLGWDAAEVDRNIDDYRQEVELSNRYRLR